LNSARTELIKGYIAKGRDKLSAARDLLQRQHYDDAVSRAYYAAFHLAQAALLVEGQQAESHKGVVMLFGLLLVKTGKIDRRFGKILANLKDAVSREITRLFRSLMRRRPNARLKQLKSFAKRLKSTFSLSLFEFSSLSTVDPLPATKPRDTVQTAFKKAWPRISSRSNSRNPKNYPPQQG